MTSQCPTPNSYWRNQPHHCINSGAFCPNLNLSVSKMCEFHLLRCFILLCYLKGESWESPVSELCPGSKNVWELPWQRPALAAHQKSCSCVSCFSPTLSQVGETLTKELLLNGGSRWFANRLSDSMKLWSWHWQIILCRRCEFHLFCFFNSFLWVISRWC